MIIIIDYSKIKANNLKYGLTFSNSDNSTNSNNGIWIAIITTRVS